MIWNLSPWWLFLAVAAVAVLAFIFSLGLNAIIGRDGFGPFGTMGIVTGGFFGSIYGVNAYGVRLSELQEAVFAGLVGAFIVEEGDEVLSITASGQVVRSPVNAEFRPTGRSAMGVKFVTPKKNDSVVVVARSVEAKVDAEDGAEDGTEDGVEDGAQPVEIADDSTTGATIDADDASDPVGQSTEDVPDDDTEDES